VEQENAPRKALFSFNARWRLSVYLRARHDALYGRHHVAPNALHLNASADRPAPIGEEPTRGLGEGLPSVLEPIGDARLPSSRIHPSKYNQPPAEGRCIQREVAVERP